MTAINKVFDLIEDWKGLPAYKAEPRIDWLVGCYLDQILYARYALRVTAIIPEFPIRVGTIYSNHENTDHADRSYKVDFYAKLEDGKNLFIEFKTDSRSRREKQDAYLIASRECGMEKIVNGVLKIKMVSPYKKKYGHLAKHMVKANLVKEIDSGMMASVVNNEIKVIYIQPKTTDLDDGFNEDDLFTFQNIAQVIEANGDLLSMRLAKCLRNWSTD